MKQAPLLLKHLRYCRRQKRENIEARRDYWHRLLTEAGYTLEVSGGCIWFGITQDEGKQLVFSGFSMPVIEDILTKYGVKIPKRRGRNRRRK